MLTYIQKKKKKRFDQHHFYQHLMQRYKITPLGSRIKAQPTKKMIKEYRFLFCSPAQSTGMLWCPSLLSSALLSTSPLKPFGQSKSKFMWNILRKGEPKKVQVGKDQEKAQSEKDSHSKTEVGKKQQTNNLVLIP